MPKNTQLVGKAPLTQVRTSAGRIVFVNQGGPVPSDLTDEDRERLLEEGYIEEIEVALDEGSDYSEEEESAPRSRRRAAKKSESDES